MTRSILHLDEVLPKPVVYESAVWKESRLWPGVRFRVMRMSLLRRHRLLQELDRLEPETTFHRAQHQVEDEISATVLQARIDEKVIRAALLDIEGLSIDGEAATVDNLIAKGPEDLAKEIAGAIADESSFSEEQRKN